MDLEKFVTEEYDKLKKENSELRKEISKLKKQINYLNLQRLKKKSYEGKIIGFIGDKSYLFDSIQQASEESKISVKRIEQCIKTGNKWKMWCFDEV